MHFTYVDPLSSDELAQGDVISRTPAVDALLKAYYNYFGANEENLYFIVITQTCDLVPREGGACKAKYIQLAAVRALRNAIQRELDRHVAPGFNVSFPIAGEKSRSKLQLFAQRLLNNNEPEYFFLHAEPERAFPEDCCAFLHLSVAIKSEHYADLLAARVLSLQPVFQAKLGWLVGQIYARVGTEDWTPDELQAKVRQIMPRAALWVDEKVLSTVATQVRDWQASNPGREISHEDVSRIIGSLPTKKQNAMNQLRSIIGSSLLIARAKQSGVANENDVEKLLSQINADQALTSFLK